MNHALRPMMPAAGFDEFKSVPAKPVETGNDNLADMTAAAGLHHGFNPCPLVLEPGGDVLDLEFSDLSLVRRLRA